MDKQFMRGKQILKRNKHFVFVDKVVIFSQNYTTVTLYDKPAPNTTRKKHLVCNTNQIKSVGIMTQKIKVT